MIYNEIKTIITFISLFFIVFTLQGCYTLSGVSVADNIRTYYVEQLRNNADNAPPTLPQTLTEALKEKIRTESRLIFNDVSPDIEFKGAIVDYRVSAEAPRPGEFTAINRLTIILAIEYINNIEKNKGWKNNFSFFFDFSSTQDLSSIQDEAIAAITAQLMEDIFNKAFTDW